VICSVSPAGTRVSTGDTRPFRARFLHGRTVMRPLMVRAVLAATDLSDSDLPALRAAVQLARLAGARLCVVHATADGVDSDMTAAVERQVRVADPDAVVLPDVCVETGPADRVVAECARHSGADVIVLGPHRAVPAGTPGSTAYNVVARTEVPCLVLPHSMRLPLGNILVPIDDSEATRGALAVALSWGSALRRRTAPGSAEATQVVVMHVTSEAGAGDAAHEMLDHAVDAVCSRVAGVTGVSVETRVVHDRSAAAAILEFANADDFDLVVLGTRAAVDGLELGSVASAVVRETSRPLLLVPPAVWRDYAADELP
jgi:nucleotide-binding universal stress UspA family protein